MKYLESNRAGQRAWYYRNIEKARALARDKYNRGMAMFRRLREGPCADCGKRFPWYVTEFDHRDPSQKRFNVSEWRKKGRGVKALQEELAKCDLVCANCHKVRTHNRRVAQMNRAAAS